MRLKYCLIASIVIISTLIFSGLTQIPLSASVTFLQTHDQLIAQSENLQANPGDKIIFGYIEDAPPVSIKSGAIVSGYCNQLATYLGQQGLQLELVPMQFSQRFRAFETIRDSVIQEKQPAIECGPSTKTIQREKDLEKLNEEKDVTSRFSNIFFTTSAKLLIQKSKLRDLNEHPENLKIGVLGSTTTQVIGQIYPTSNIRSVEDRTDAIGQLVQGGQNGGIDAYASDEILLMGIRNDNEFTKRKEFVIEPKLYGFTREEYGVVIYNDDSLRDKINDWINGDGQNAKRDLERQVFISSMLRGFVSSDYFYLVLLGILAAFALLLISHPWFTFLILKLIPVKLANRFLDWLKARRRQKGKNDLIVVFTNKLLNNEVFTVVAHNANDKFNIGFIDSDAAIKLVEEVGIQPLLRRYREDGLPQEKAEEKVVEVIKVSAENNHQIYKMLQTWVDAAGTTAANEIATKIIERVLGQAGN